MGFWKPERQVPSDKVSESTPTAHFPPLVVPTLTRPPVIIEGEPRVAGTGIGPRDICTQLLAVAVATFIDV